MKTVYHAFLARHTWLAGWLWIAKIELCIVASFAAGVLLPALIRIPVWLPFLIILAMTGAAMAYVYARYTVIDRKLAALARKCQNVVRN